MRLPSILLLAPLVLATGRAPMDPFRGSEPGRDLPTYAFEHRLLEGCGVFVGRDRFEGDPGRAAEGLQRLDWQLYHGVCAGSPQVLAHLRAGSVWLQACHHGVARGC